MRFFTRQINPRYLGSRCVKGTEESTSRVYSSVPLTHCDPKDLGLICLVRKHKIHFRILSDLRIQSWIFLKKRTLRHVLFINQEERRASDTVLFTSENNDIANQSVDTSFFTSEKKSFISYLLRFSDRIDRMKNLYGNFFIQSQSRIDFLKRGKSRFIQSEISCQNVSEHLFKGLKSGYRTVSACTFCCTYNLFATNFQRFTIGKPLGMKDIFFYLFFIKQL